MITSIKFKNFRRFKELSMEKLPCVTLISGKNNVGKTTVLEGVFVFCAHLLPDAFMRINYLRAGYPILTANTPEQVWETAFHEFNTAKPMEISAVYDDMPAKLLYIRDDSFIPNIPSHLKDKEIAPPLLSTSQKNYSLKFEFTRGDYLERGYFSIIQNSIFREMSDERQQIVEQPVQAQFINSFTAKNTQQFVTYFGQLERADKVPELLEKLKIIEPELKEIKTILVNNQAQLYCKARGKLMPLQLAGDGLVRLLCILVAIISNPNTIMLIDEIENGFHYSVYAKIWETIASAAKEYNCQIIATTHSYECIASALQGVCKAILEDDFCYYRLGRQEDQITAYCFSFEQLREALKSDLEVR